jgi:predicted membrane-bound spermidine synthase
MRTAPIPHLLLLLSGAAGLSHQVLWTRRLVDLLGAGGDTFARVVGAFFIGLALGGAASALWPVPLRHAWRRVALAELAVALLAIPVLFAVPIADTFREVLPTGRFGTLLAVLFVTLPALVMGLVLPAAVTATRTSGSALSLYVVNTLGGILGILGVVLVVLPRLGLLTAGWMTCSLNLLVAAVAGWLSGANTRGLETALPANPTASQAPIRFPSVLAFGSGFLVLALEVVLQHQCAQVTINSGFSGALVLAFVLAALVAAGALSGLARTPGSIQGLLQWTLLAAVGIAALQPLVFQALRPGLRFFAYELSPVAYLLRVTALALAVIVPVFLAAGFTFPLLLRTVGASRDGRRELALLLAVNGLGGWLGAETAQGLLVPAAGLWGSTVILAGLALVLWLLVAWDHLFRCPAALTGLVGGLATLAAGGLVVPRLPQVAPESGITLAKVRVSREGVVAAVHGASNDWRIVFNNTYTLGGSRAQFNQERQAHLPILLHAGARSVALLGVATGSTTAGAALHPSVERIDAFELSRTVIDFARDYFAPYNRGIFQDSRVQVSHEDARIGVQRNSGQYDVVIGDLFLPWRTGEGRLFTREHFAAVRRSLRSRGLYCQWLPLFQLTRPQFANILRTFRAEFPDAFLIRGDFYSEQPIVGLVGGRPLPEIPWDRVSAACDRLRSGRKVTDGLVRHSKGVAMCLIGPAPDPGPGPLNTLDNGWLEWNAGRNVVGLREPWFIGVPYAEFVRDCMVQGTRFLPEELREAQDSGQFFLTLDIAAKLGLPARGNLEAQIPTRIPTALQDDFQADWRQWPSRVKPFVATGPGTPR